MKKQHLRVSRLVFAVVSSAFLLTLILYGLGAGSAQARSAAPALAVLRGRVSVEQSSILTKTVVPPTAVEDGDELTYTIVISAAPGVQVGFYDRLTHTTFVRFVERPSTSGITHTGGVVTGTLTVTPTNQVTLSFAVRVNPGTLAHADGIANRACIYPFGGTLEGCVWSNTVVNLLIRRLYLPLLLRSYTPLQAGFTASPVWGRAPLTVTFTNTSVGFYTDSLWDFGDGITSTHTSLTHTYMLTGTYSVTLTVVDASGTLAPPRDSSTLVRSNYITVSEEGPPAAPSDLEATALNWREIRLDWRDNSFDETGFIIFDGTPTQTHVVSNTTAYTFTGLSPGSYHCYLVRAFNEFGESDWNDDDSDGEPDWACTTTPTCTFVLVNGGFEGNEGWTFFPDTPYPATYTLAITHTGSRSLRTGIVDSVDDVESYSSAQQTVTIPSDVVSATLGFWLYTTSEEITLKRQAPAPPRGAVFEAAPLADDLQYVLVMDEEDNVLGSPLVWDRMNDREWVYREFELAKPVYLGHTVKLRFGTFNDGRDGVTAMYVDDVSMELCGSTDVGQQDKRR
jgi:PKD repeat protein